jgi:hypothetical protein
MKMDISEIKDLINAISNSKIDIFDYEENGAKLHLEKKTEVEVIASPKPVAQDVLVKQENTEESIEQKEVLTGTNAVYFQFAEWLLFFRPNLLLTQSLNPVPLPVLLLPETLLVSNQRDGDAEFTTGGDGTLDLNGRGVVAAHCVNSYSHYP